MTGLMAVSVLLLTLLAAPAHAQCTLQDTTNQCLEKRDASAAGALMQAEAEDVLKRELALTNTGTTDSESLHDFASRFRLALDSINFGANDAQGLKFDWNGVLNDVLVSTFFGEDEVWEWARSSHKISATINDPELYPALVETLTEDQKAALLGRVDDFDDLTVSFDWAPKNSYFGRSIGQHSNAYNNLFEALYQSKINNLAAANQPYIALMNGVIQALNAADRQIVSGLLSTSNADDLYDVPLQDIYLVCQNTSGCPAGNVVNSLVLISRAGDTLASVQDEITLGLNSGVMNDWRKLIGNQPQLVFSVRHRARTDVVGPDESSLKFTYEWARFNVNHLRRTSSDYATNVSSILDFVNRYRDQIDAGARLSLALEYVDKDDFSFSEANYPGLVSTGASSLIFSTSFSRTVQTGSILSDAGLFSGKPGRFEFTVAYEDVDNDPLRNERMLSNLTFTQEISEGAVLTFGFVYANKPEYLGQVDKEISARFGVNYKLGEAE